MTDDGVKGGQGRDDEEVAGTGRLLWDFCLALPAAAVVVGLLLWLFRSLRGS